ncbi:Protein affecting phage T7 exclusion by the F plasmid, UPF0716 family [Rhizobium sp. RU20A]|uniref:FxsA family protein n=1 Tax=Rhizobium sp. RU20A TaxID=1907412 RepID=UPI00095509C7|nr:FxsA family protein [Rhizobium sp. RU20A]SIQ84368.1 Protein affecting phage T7 exclusion by the F plasmid, UPF0716 family [Rhizobium sp. RU20A]
MLRSILVPFVLLMPVIELFSIILVASKLGFLATVGWLALDLLIGGLLIRLSGARMKSQRMFSLSDRAQIGELVKNSAIVLAGVLIAIPGFVTDVLGLLILFPPTRVLLARALVGKVVVTRNDVRGGFSAEFRSTGAGFEEDLRQRGFSKEGSAHPHRPGAQPVVDLDPEEFHRDGNTDGRGRLNRPNEP